MGRPVLFSERNGRFNVKSAPASTVIAKGVTGSFYRILNSGDTEIQVVCSGSALSPVKIKPRQSVDITFGNQDEVAVAPVTASADISGIYDTLPTSGARSGRFVLDPLVVPGINPNSPSLIVDLSNNQSKDPDYRFFNTGHFPIVIMKGSGAVAPSDVVFTLNKDQSVDLRLEKGKAYYVKSGSAGKPVSGAFDLIGTK